MTIFMIAIFRSNLGRLFVLSFLCLLFLDGCIGNKRVSTVVYEEKNRSVRLESRLAQDNKPIEYGYQHPATLTQEDLEKILSSIYIKRPKTLLGLLIPILGSKDREPAFSPDEIQFLSKQLQKALAVAKPYQRVTFFLKRPHGMWRQEITSGALFVREGQLYFILANDRAMLDQEKNMTVVDEDNPLYVYDHSAFEILPGEHQKLIKADQKMQDQAGLLPKTGLEIDYQKILSSQPTAEPQAASGPSLQTSPQNPPTESNSASPLEEKLRLLKRLREQGLISEEEYQAKKKELLRGF
jgi:Short C-terminal domain